MLSNSLNGLPSSLALLEIVPASEGRCLSAQSRDTVARPLKQRNVKGLRYREQVSSNIINISTDLQFTDSCEMFKPAGRGALHLTVQHVGVASDHQEHLKITALSELLVLIVTSVSVSQVSYRCPSAAAWRDPLYLLFTIICPQTFRQSHGQLSHKGHAGLPRPGDIVL
ncbi:hypothetical protein DFJ77DRAFT_467370 [Powellomyces hirtus]|nr:hypothetical protein DFJ77DRAFT_467370 [Powellomyces hirtus]